MEKLIKEYEMAVALYNAAINDETTTTLDIQRAEEDVERIKNKVKKNNIEYERIY